MDDPLPPPVVVDPTDPTSPPIIISGSSGSGPVGAISGDARTIDMAHGYNWLWFFELVQAFRDVHGVGQIPRLTKAWSEKGRVHPPESGPLLDFQDCEDYLDFSRTKGMPQWLSLIERC